MEKATQCVIALRTIVNMKDDSKGKTKRELLEYTRKVALISRSKISLHAQNMHGCSTMQCA